MGCDIHVTVQRRVNGAWVDGQDWEEKYGYPSPVGGELFGDRNYALFTILANVRGEIYNPLAAGRGLPDEISHQMRDFHADNHSATYFTVAEVLAYDWTQSLTLEGWVTPVEFGAFKVNGHPESWCGMVGGGSVRHISAELMASLIESTNPGRERDGSKEYPFHDIQWEGRKERSAWLDAIRAEVGGSPYCAVQWERPFYTQGGDFLKEAMPRAWNMGAPEDVRFVISFDS